MYETRSDIFHVKNEHPRPTHMPDELTLRNVDAHGLGDFPPSSILWAQILASPLIVVSNICLLQRLDVLLSDVVVLVAPLTGEVLIDEGVV